MRYEDASHAGAFQGSGPIANDDSDTLPAGSKQAATGNLITGEGTQHGSAGEDSAAGGHIISIAGKGGEDFSLSGGKLSVGGEFGNLRVDAEGNYSYLANKSAPENVRDRFTYTLADSQGNTDTAALVVELGKTPVAIKANAQQIVPGPDGVVTLPPGVELSDIMVVGRNLLINLPDGSQMIIVDGAVFVPQLSLDGVEIPATNLATLLIGQEPQPAAGEIPPSSGGNFALPPPPLDPGFPLGDLIPPTEYGYIPPEPPELFPDEEDDNEPEAGSNPDVRLDDDALLGGNAGGTGDDSPDLLNVSGTLSGSGGDGTLTFQVLLTGAPSGFTYVTGGTGIVLIQQGGVTVITVTVDSAGNYTVVQNAAIDHAAGSDENNAIFTLDYTVTDEDGGSASGTLTIDADDDTPIATQLQVGGMVDEDGVPGGIAGGPGDVAGENTIVNGSVAGLFSAGADAPVTFGLSSNTSGLPSLASNGVAVTYQVAGNTLTASASGTPVFTLVVNADGSYTFTLLDQLDHPSLNGQAGDDTENDLSLALGSIVQATDADGDVATAPANGLLIGVNDDTPTNAQGTENAAVDEDELPDGITDGDGETTTATGSLSALASAIGADQPGGFGWDVSALGGLPALTSNGVPVSYAIVGNSLVAYTGADANNAASQVFRVELQTNGDYEVTLLAQVDHLPNVPIDDDDQELTIDLSGLVQIADADGDVVHLGAGQFTLDIEDDIPAPADDPTPVAGQVDEDLLADGNNDSASGDDPGGTTASGAAGSLLSLFDIGADQPGKIVLLSDTSGLPALTSNGVAVTYAVAGNVLTASAGATSVFTLTVNGDGSWEFVLLDQLDHDIAGTEDNLLIDFSSVIDAEDADGDGADPLPNGSFVIDVDDDMPLITRNFAVVPVLVTDDTDIPDTAGPVSFAGLFDESFGADGPGADAVSYGLSITGGDGTDSGLIDVISGDAILLRVNGDGDIEGYLANDTGTVAFIIDLDPATGEISLEQDRAIAHDDPADPVESGISAARMAADLIVLTATITDGDGDSASASANIGLSFNFEDDGPTIARNQATVPVLVTDDTDIPDTAGPVSFAGLFDFAFGSDGPRDVDDNDVADADALAFSLSITGGDGTDSGLIDVISGDAILLRVNGDGDIEGYLANDTGTVAFTIDLDPATGEISLEQARAIAHDDPVDPVESGLSAATMTADLIVLTATITDGDGDSASASANIGLSFNFEDDGPTIARNQATVPVLVTDDTDTPNDVAGPSSFASLFDSAFGNDGPLDVDDNDVADADALAFSLSITGGDGTDSGLIDVISGNAILLRVNVDGDIEGYLANDTGTVAFIIDLDPATGEISLEQDRAITHNDPADPVESGLSAATMAANLIILTATVTDGDGDTAAAIAEIGDAFAFEDDGPDAFDEPEQDVPEGQTISGAFDFDPGADGAAVTHINDTLLVFDAVTGWSQWIMVDEGQIRAMAGGSYEFQANLTGSLVTSGTFTVTDGDGDPDTANWAFNITDANSPTAGVSTARVDDDGLTSPAGNPASTTGDVNANASPPEAAPIDPSEAIFHGQLTLNFGADGPGTVTFAAMHNVAGTVGTDSVLYTWNAGTSTLTATITTPGSPRNGATLFDIVVNQTTGEYTLTLRDNVLHDAGGDETSAPNVALTYTVTDSDNLPVGSADGTLNIDFNDDAPTVTVTAAIEPNLVVDESDFTVDAGPTSFAALFDVNFGADGAAATGALDYELTINTGDTGLVDTLTGEDVMLVKNGETIEGRTVTTNALVFVISVNAAGEVSLDQQRSIVHPDPANPNESITLADDSLITLSLTATDGDGDLHTVADPINIAQNFVFFDDAPSTFNPQDAILANGAGGQAFFLLDPVANGGDNNILNNFGADGPGFVRFPSTIDNTDSGLTSGAVKIWYILDPTGQILLGKTGVDAATAEASGTTIFTITIDQANSRYSIDMDGTVDAFTTINFSDGSYDFVGGNDAWAGFVPTGQKESGTPVNDDSQDLLLTPIGSGTSVNGNANTAGVTGGIAGQNIGSGEGMRLDFVEDLTGTPTTGDYNVVGEQNHDFDAHYLVNGATLQFDQGTSPLTKCSFKAILVSPLVIDDNGDDGTPDLVDGTGTLVSVTRIIISYDGENQVVDFNPLDPGGTQAVTVGNAGGLTDRTYLVHFVQSGGEWYAEVTGVYDGLVRIATIADEMYNALELLHLGPATSNADFAISGFGVAVQSTDPVLFSLPVEIVDGDGDVVAATDDINITLNPAAPLLAPLAAESTSLETNGSATKLGWSEPRFVTNNDSERFAGGQGHIGVMAGILAAAGMMAKAAAAPIDRFGSSDHQAGDPATDIVGQLVGGPAEDIASRSLPMPDANFRAEFPESVGSSTARLFERTDSRHSVDDSPARPVVERGDQQAVDAGPAASSFEASPVAPTVNMPSAEALQAAGLDDNAQEDSSVEQVVAEALDYADTSPIDTLLANLPGGYGGLEAIAQLLIPGNEVVSGWSMAQHDSAGAGFDVSSRIDVTAFHHDAVQPTING